MRELIVVAAEALNLSATKGGPADGLSALSLRTLTWQSAHPATAGDSAGTGAARRP